ncbi:MAG TPA: CAP domain-containing protein [Solirubrobacteraceae bacterium]|nr:CAP domain-containing protein [Solirubrobacteraceae bacterium]
MRRFAILHVLLAAGVLAGCGSTSDPAGPSAAAPLTPGAPLSVGVTDGRLGGALTDTSDGRQRELSEGGRVDPRVLRPAPNVREGIAAGDSCGNADLAPDGANLGTIAVATLCLLNAERGDRGLATLKPHRSLERAALVHGGDMVEHSYFSHDGRNGSRPAQRIRAAGYLSSDGAWRIGENLAWGTGDLATPRAIMSAWMASSGHRANILQPAYREIGISVLPGNPASRDGSGATFVTEFGVVERVSRVASRRTEGRTVRRSDRGAARKQRAAKRTRRTKARRARARVALAPRSRRARKVGRVVAVRAGLR